MFEINVVGTLSNSDEISEIIDVAQVFAIEERMKNIVLNSKTKTDFKKSYLPNKEDNKQKNYNDFKNIFSVRGFN